MEAQCGFCDHVFPIAPPFKKPGDTVRVITGLDSVLTFLGIVVTALFIACFLHWFIGHPSKDGYSVAWYFELLICVAMFSGIMLHEIFKVLDKFYHKAVEGHSIFQRGLEIMVTFGSVLVVAFGSVLLLQYATLMFGKPTQDEEHHAARIPDASLERVNFRPVAPSTP